MGSYAQLKIGDISVSQFKSEVEPWVALVFTADDRRTRPATDVELERAGVDEPWHVTELVAPADVVRDRLELTGADWGAAVTAFDELVAQQIETHTSVRESTQDETIRKRIDEENKAIRKLDLDAWVDALCSSRPDTAEKRTDLGTRSWLLDLWEYGDIRLCLRAVLECRPSDVVTLDVTDLIDGGWLTTDEDPREAALSAFGWAERYASPIVVLTEGSTDTRVLETALEIVYPHLRGFIRFADFTHQQEANAGALVKTVKAFAAAGITNRVVALFDADSAARDAVRSLDTAKLPASIQVRHLPRIEIGDGYPTIGPSGDIVADDINGRACSLELYFGRDVLTEMDGSLRPVLWTAFVHGVNAWQGVIERKAELQDRFWSKAEAAKDPASRSTQDWSGLRAVLDEVRFAFTDPREGWAARANTSRRDTVSSDR
jgi:hypothetical protein